MSKGIVCLIIVVMTASVFAVCFSDDSSAGTNVSNDSVALILKGDDGSVLSRVSMSYSDAVLDSDVRHGKLTYSLKCDSSSPRLPSSMLFSADGGNYHVDVSVIGLQNTEYASEGVRMVAGGEYSCDLTSTNLFKSTLSDYQGNSNFDSNRTYDIVLYSKESGSIISPESLNGVWFTFSWFASDGTHIIMFVDDGEDFGLIIAFEGNQVQLPKPSGGKEFDCWIDQDQKMYNPGSTIVVETDIVMYAAWGEDNPVPLLLFSAIYIIIIIVFLGVSGNYVVHRD